MKIVSVIWTPAAQKVYSDDGNAAGTINETDMGDGQCYLFAESYFDWSMNNVSEGYRTIPWRIIMPVVATFCFFEV